MLKTLVEHKQDLNVYDENPQMRFYKRTALSFATELGLQPVVEQLLAAKASTEVRDKSLQTPLHYAAWGDKLPIAKILLAAKADLGATDWSGMTPLHTVATNDAAAVACLLLVRCLRTVTLTSVCS